MGNSVVGTIADVATDKRTYYKCPRCGKEKWAYGTFAGTQCLDCTPSNPVGTAVDVVTHTADMVVDTTVGVATGGQVKITGAVSGSVGYLTDKATNGNKGQVSYNCPVCKKEVWAYGSYAGTTCKKCMSEGKVDESDYKSNGAAKLNKDAGHLFEAQKPKRLGALRSDDEQVLRLRVLSVPIGKGALRDIGDDITKSVFGQGIDHWWGEIETNKGWYIAHFDGGSQLELSQKSSQNDVTETGLAVVGATLKSGKKITVEFSNHISTATKTRTMKQVKDWMKKYDGNYDLKSNNCQHFATALYYWI